MKVTMNGRCMCGDPYCPSCGPAQGYNPDEELVTEWLAEVIKWPDIIDSGEATYVVVKAIGEYGSQDLVDAMTADARNWARSKNFGAQK